MDANKWNGYIAGNQYASKHDGLVNFCFADCSVRAIRTTCDYDTFAKSMAGWRDGKVVDYAGRVTSKEGVEESYSSHLPRALDSHLTSFPDFSTTVVHSGNDLIGMYRVGIGL